MQFGIFVPARVDMGPMMRRVERAGFTHGWLYDSQMLFADVYSCLTVCLQHTDRLVMGPGVTNPASRIAPLTASCLATLNQVAPGRVVLGIGTGNTTRRTMGFPPARVDAMAEYIRVCQALLRHDRTRYRETEGEHEIGMIGGGDGFMRFDEHIPIIVSAFGSRTLTLAGEIGDGVMIGGQPTEQSMAETNEHLRAGADRSGRDVDDLEIVLYTSMYVLEPSEDLGSQRLRDTLVPLVAPAIARYATRAVSLDDVPEVYRDAVAAYRERHGELRGASRYLDTHDGYLWNAPDDVEPLVTAEMLRRSALIGSADQILARVREWEALGVTQVGLRAGGGVDNVAEFSERFGDAVITRY
jgi:alkanesulfonate monooxygenase SsuD/methylene tetrahydromethanopterin reductase-like flavin-dependent oxidoreductase (luciferase family)